MHNLNSKMHDFCSGTKTKQQTLSDKTVFHINDKTELGSQSRKYHMLPTLPKKYDNYIDKTHPSFKSFGYTDKIEV